MGGGYSRALSGQGVFSDDPDEGQDPSGVRAPGMPSGQGGGLRDGVRAGVSLPVAKFHSVHSRTAHSLEQRFTQIRHCVVRDFHEVKLQLLRHHTATSNSLAISFFLDSSVTGSAAALPHNNRHMAAEHNVG